MNESVRIIRSYDDSVTFDDCWIGDRTILDDLASIFVAFDDVTVHGHELEGGRFELDHVVNNNTGRQLSDIDIWSGYYEAFSPRTIIIPE